MRSRAQVTAQKLRGGFYTPAPLVDHCLRRVEELVARDCRLRVLEPSAGDGAFLRGLARSDLHAGVGSVTALEPLAPEAEKARRALDAAGLHGAVEAASAVGWAARTAATFDVAVGNPPFVRYQFVSSADRDAAGGLARRIGVELGGVANLWIPVLLGALSRVAPGGVFAFVVPSECFTGVSAGVVRAWVLTHCDRVRFDHFAPGSFPGVLQEVGVLSGQRVAAPHGGAELALVGHDDAGGTDAVSHTAPATSASWTRYLLDRPALEAFEIAAAAGAGPLGDVVRFEVSIVTGANDFFSASDATVSAHGLSPWARPLLPRIRHAPGLVLTAADMTEARRRGARTNLLDFAADRPDPTVDPGAGAYLRDGWSRGLAERYKCRIREPWFRVPGIRRGSLLLSKRCHFHPRVVLDTADVFTTDTIYRGEVTADVAPGALAAMFHNALTLLSAELEGRSFGGGVLELVPSEIARLALPSLGGAEAHLAALDRVARSETPDALVRATNAILARRTGIDPEVLDVLDAARRTLRDRRFARAGHTRARTLPPPLTAAASAAVATASTPQIPATRR